MPNGNDDVTLMYQGGSGGFLLYYLMLLSGEFYDQETENKIKMQFPEGLKYDRGSWKITEIWPDNEKLKQTPADKKKLFLICNPFFNTKSLPVIRNIVNNTQVVLLYTTLDCQLRMAYEKNAYWFTPVSKRIFNAPASNFKYIKKIKSSGKSFNQEIVDPMVPLIVGMFRPKIISLQTVISDRSSYNEQQNKFLDHWLNLQSPKALRCLNI